MEGGLRLHLFYVHFGLLPWVLIINMTLPLAMFFRFMMCTLHTGCDKLAVTAH